MVRSLSVATRKYEQRLRAEAAEETRRRILDAVYERLREDPSHPVSVDRVAQEAKVARSTVYLIFGSRAGLFDALCQDLFERAGYGRLIQAKELPDARDHLRYGIRTGVEMYAAFRDVAHALYSMTPWTRRPRAARSSAPRMSARRGWPVWPGAWRSRGSPR